MSKFTTPTETHTPSDPEVSQAERDQFLEEMGAVKTTGNQAIRDKKTFEDVFPEIGGIQSAPSGGQIPRMSDVATAISSAVDPITDELDSDVIKTTGDQSMQGKKTFSNVFPEIGGIQSAPSGGQIPRMSDVVTEINALGTWSTITLSYGWMGSVKCREDRWGYIEIIADGLDSTNATDYAIFTLPIEVRPNYDVGGIVVPANPLSSTFNYHLSSDIVSSDYNSGGNQGGFYWRFKKTL